jgi:hypothetical protein
VRTISIQVYFKDSPTPWVFDNVTNITTEGGLLRVTQGPGQNQWFPLTNVFRIKELERKEVA